MLLFVRAPTSKVVHLFRIYPNNVVNTICNLDARGWNQIWPFDADGNRLCKKCLRHLRHGLGWVGLDVVSMSDNVSCGT
jgi:hypothetical protein